MSDLHSIGPYINIGGFIHCTLTNSLVEHPALVVDRDCGCVLKNGEYSMVKQWFGTAVSAMREIDPKCNYQLLSFDKFKRVLSTDEICTFINYLRNSLSVERVYELLTMGEDPLKKELSRLSEMGF